MALIAWNSNYSVGIASIDGQHKKLIDIINELNEAMSAGKSKEVLSKIFGELISYTKVHFKYEEDIFAKHGYTEQTIHKMHHDRLTNEVVKYENDFKKGKLTISISLMTFLRDWLTKHILGEDKKYTAFLTSKGVK